MAKGPFKSLVVLGDSVVEGGGWLAQASERWADLLWHLLETAQESSIMYHNAGVGASVISPQSPGYAESTKPSASERLDSEVIAHRPDLVVIAYGLNDMRAGMAPEAFEVEIKAILTRLRDALDAAIVIVNVYHIASFRYYPPFDRGSVEATQQYNAMLRRLAESTDCIYADVWSAEGCKDHLVHQDTVHPNKLGNMLIANKVFEAIALAEPGIADRIRERNAQTEWTEYTRRMRES